MKKTSWTALTLPIIATSASVTGCAVDPDVQGYEREEKVYTTGSNIARRERDTSTVVIIDREGFENLPILPTPPPKAN